MIASIQGIGADFDRAMATFHEHWTGIADPIHLAVPRLADDVRTSTDYAVQLRRTTNDSHCLERTHIRASQSHRKEFYSCKAFGTLVQPRGELWVKSTAQAPVVSFKFTHD
ncbi:hypothetical protein D915_009447 [Fasciola hepatica]|uniref:Uncharacterized protein n=1 Tax=Fasciola hepatica TaxID=6192 RepID=A0A4E0RSC0_FASHE|nr:hypothetical protein D915_009447 [Fasciola hepatica]